MENVLNRRDFMMKSTIASTVAFFPKSLLGMRHESVGFQLIDYHVHLSLNFSIEQAVELAKSRNVKFGIVEHPGFQNAIKNDDDLKAYINKLKKYPVYIGLQPIRRD